MKAGVSLFQRSDSVEPDSTAAPDLTGSARLAVLDPNPDVVVNADTNGCAINAADTNGCTDACMGARLAILNGMSDDELMRLLLHATRKRAADDADLLLCLSEIDRRKLYRNHACGSLFAYCVSRLGFSEEAAYKRVGVARLLRYYPLVYELLSEGKVHLSAVILVKPHLTRENHRDWLLSVCGKSKREVERLVAARCPKPDVVASVRRLPSGVMSAPRPVGIQEEVGSGLASTDPSSARILPERASHECEMAARDSQGTTPATVVASAPVDVTSPAVPSCSAASTTVLVSKSSAHSLIQPLSAYSYRVVFTASEQLKDKLDRARVLLSHTVAAADLPGLIERALDVLIARTEVRRFGAKQPRKPKTSPREQLERRSRYIPAAVRRAVWDRDEGRCTYVDVDGHRCEERTLLQLDHREPFGLGGAHTAEVLRLRCAAHNALCAEEIYGKQRIAAAVATSRAKGRAK